ncbi:Noc2-domain-containing protein [Cylindrobasidium torrendii FP15055 ss-10]|uniref:Noc2-domain-containing protein n=1 Tax=Cylindrobasidium torrendii FP15055 ss-10 TaxID=1314674 RepID=A0A0D7B2K0_9AGAR|nr:Noc2-domain-containing protein [Cylindrobasidium torrendii FP15055 ss-10]
MPKPTKASKKFRASGGLQKTIESRRKAQAVRRAVQGRRRGAHKGAGAAAKHGGSGGAASGAREKHGRGEEEGHAASEEEDVDMEDAAGGKKGGKKMSVDAFLGGGFMDEDEDASSHAPSEDSDLDGEDLDAEGEGEEEDAEENFSDVDALDDDGEASAESHAAALAALSKTDPEFYAYLQENDRELLDFGVDGDEEGGSDEDGEEETKRTKPLTVEIIRGWQKALIEQKSLRALRKLLVAFRAAVHMHDEDQKLAWSFDSAAVYRKLITTALKYTPVVLAFHCPLSPKTGAPVQTPKLRTLQKLILSFFHNAMTLVEQVTDAKLLRVVVEESARVVGYVGSSRKSVKAYLRVCLGLVAARGDNDEGEEDGEGRGGGRGKGEEREGVRMAAMLAVRRLAQTSRATLDLVLKATYLTFLRTCKNTNAHTLGVITFMKNSGAELFALDTAAAYPLAFGYIRQLAILLRNAIKVKGKGQGQGKEGEKGKSEKAVWNWQYVHGVDFWVGVLVRCAAGGGGGEMKALVYPLVQVSLGALGVLPSARAFPFHLHILRSLVRLSSSSGGGAGGVYIPLAPYILALLLPSAKEKGSTLAPLDLDTSIRCPAQYAGTRVYGEGVRREAAWVLAVWMSAEGVCGSVAFPEVAGGVVRVLRRGVRGGGAASSSAGGGKGKGKGKKGAKKGGGAKHSADTKVLIERIEASAAWVQTLRASSLNLVPTGRDEVGVWEEELRGKVRRGESPLGRWVQVQGRVRERERERVERARVGRGEVLGDDVEDASEGEGSEGEGEGMGMDVDGSSDEEE